MASQAPEIIASYEVLFAVRTGVTVLVPRLNVFDDGGDSSARFRVSPENPQDILIDGGGRAAVLKNLQKDYLEESVERGFIMFYEMQDDEVVRCTSCKFSRQ